MRSRSLSALLVVGLVPAVLALPVVTPPRPAPHPVRSHTWTGALSGVDAAAQSSFDRDVARGSAGLSWARGLGRPAVLTSARVTSTFTAIGVTWRPTAGVAAPVVHVRVRAAGHWTAWEPLDVADTPDAGSADAATGGLRLGTEPLLTDPSDGYQVRLDRAGARLPDGLRVDLVDPGHSAADSDLTPTAPAASAEAAASTPTIITRAQWGADESIRECCPRYMPTIKAAFIHHTDTSNTYSMADAAAQVRAIYAYHVKANGWSDIGYNFLVDRYGRIFEGRYGGVDKAVKGAHTGGFNQNTFGVAALGTFTTATPPAAMVSSIEKVIAWKLDLYHRDPLAKVSLTSEGGGTAKYAAGTTVTFNTINGHRDAGYTSCPGNALYAKLPAVRTAVKSLMGAVIYNPTQNFYSALPGSATPLTVTARTNAVAPWAFTVTDARGLVVRSVKGTSTPSLTATWNLTAGGKAAPAGKYTISLTSTTARPYTSTLTLVKPIVYDPPPPTGTPTPYWKQGYQTYGGRQWYTTCEYYGTAGAYRCLAKIWATTIVRTSSGGYATKNAWVFNNLTYYDYDRPSWSSDPLARTGTFSSSGRQWKTSCTPNVTTGARACNTWLWSTVLTRTKTSSGTYVYRQYSTWFFNNRVYLVVKAA